MKSVSKACSFFVLIVFFGMISSAQACFEPSDEINRTFINFKDGGDFNIIECIDSYTPFDYIRYILPDRLVGKDLYLSYILKIHEEFYPEVDPYIVMAVMETESRYDPDAISSAGAVGLMQLLPKYHAKRVYKYGLTDLMDPYTNILAGMDLLDELYKSSSGNWKRALLGYNNSTSYANYVLAKSEELRAGGYFG